MRGKRLPDGNGGKVMYIDIAIIALVVIGALIGLWRGFFKSLISFFGWTVSFIIAVFITKPIAGALLDLAKIRRFVVGTSGWSLYTWIHGKLDFIGTGSFLETILRPVLKVAQSVEGDLVSNVALLLANGVFNVIVCIALLLLLRLLMLLFTMFANAMTKDKCVGALNRLLGMVFGAVKGFALVVFIMMMFTFVMGLSFMSKVRDQIDDNHSVIAAPLYKQVSRLTNKLLSGNKTMLEKLITFAGLDKIAGDGDEQTPAYVGEYISEEDGTSQIVITLRADGTFTQSAAGDERTGTYMADGNALQLTFADDGETVDCELHADEGWFKMGDVYLAKEGVTVPHEQDYVIVSFSPPYRLCAA